jgi:hypothetical protein
MTEWHTSRSAGTPSTSPRETNEEDYSGHPGLGNWRTFPTEHLELVRQSAAKWSELLEGVSKPWLCWNVNRRWCALQQRIIQEFGWTPVVGGDPRFGTPIVIPGSISINFNESLNYSMMLPLFPLEFAYLFTKKLAFMHSDLFCRMQVMEKAVRVFDRLDDGEMAAPYSIPGRRNIFNVKLHRYWDLITCTTRGASRDQFEQGAGWWRHFSEHPNCPNAKERKRRASYYYDFGSGIAYWRRHLGGRMSTLRISALEEGHCSSIGHPQYTFIGTRQKRSLDQELDANYSLDEVARRLGLLSYLTEVDTMIEETRPTQNT